MADFICEYICSMCFSQFGKIEDMLIQAEQEI